MYNTSESMFNREIEIILENNTHHNQWITDSYTIILVLEPFHKYVIMYAVMRHLIE